MRGAAGERLLYLPSLGYCMLLAAALFRLPGVIIGVRTSSVAVRRTRLTHVTRAAGRSGGRQSSVLLLLAITGAFAAR